MLELLYAAARQSDLDEARQKVEQGRRPALLKKIDRLESELAEARRQRAAGLAGRTN